MKLCNLLFCFSFVLYNGCKMQNSEQVKNGDELLQKYYEAVGGYDNIKSIQTKILKGHYIEPGYNLMIKAHMEYKRPHYRIIGDTAMGYAEGFDGKTWEYNNKKGFYRSEGEAEKATKRGSEFDDPFIDYEEKGNKIEYRGIAELEGQRYHELLLTYPEGDIKRYFFDLSNHLPRYMIKTMPLHAVGEPIDYLVTITDYRRVGLVLFPFTSIERNIKTGKLIHCTLLNEVILNQEIPINKFSPPLNE